MFSISLTKFVISLNTLRGVSGANIAGPVFNLENTSSVIGAIIINWLYNSKVPIPIISIVLDVRELTDCRPIDRFRTSSGCPDWMQQTVVIISIRFSLSHFIYRRKCYC